MRFPKCSENAMRSPATFSAKKTRPRGRSRSVMASKRPEQAGRAKLVRRPEEDLNPLRQMLPVARRNIHPDRRRSFGGMRPGAHRDHSQLRAQSLTELGGGVKRPGRDRLSIDDRKYLQSSTPHAG